MSTALDALGVTGLFMVSLDLATGSSIFFQDGVWERLAVYSVLVWGVLLPAAAALRLWRSTGRAGAPVAGAFSPLPARTG